MSMLAEPRRRKQYHLNPRGKALYEDESRFGTKMLEKMGWAKGKGLGANESGSLEFVRVRFKDNFEGLGYANTIHDDQWTAHDEGFNGLLKNLNGDATDGGPKSNKNNNVSDDESEDEHRPIGFGFKTVEFKPEKKKLNLKENISGISLEEKSKSSKARVHYKKFTRGKDLSLYSEKDLANIFGKKAVENEVDDIYQQLNKSIGLEKTKNVNVNFAGVQTVSSGLSLTEYFKQKMDAIRSKNKSVAQMKEPELQPLVNDDESEVNIGGEEPSTKKSKKKKKAILNEQIEENLVVKEIDPLVNNESEALTGKELSVKVSKKNKKCILNEQNEENLVVKEIVNNEEELSVKESKKTKKCILNEQSEENSVVKEKITKKCQKEEKEESLPEPTGNKEPAVEDAEPKRKKKKKNDDKVLTTAADLEPVIERNGENIEENSMIIKKKNKKTKKEEVVEESENGDLNKVNSIEAETIAPAVQLEEKQVQISLKKKKKSKKNKETAPEEIQDENKFLEESNQLQSNKKKKQKNQIKSEKEFEEKPDDDVSELLSDQDQEPIDKSSIEDSATQKQKELLSMEQLLEKCDSFNVFKISTFTAEKFRNFNLNTFRGSNLSKITGYSCTDNVKLNIVQSKRDEKRILQLWSNQTIKYGDSSNNSFNKRHIQPLHKTTKRKKIRTHLNAIKRRSAFTII